MSYDAVGNVLSRTATEAAVSGQSGTGGSETQNFCYDEQNHLIWTNNTTTVPSVGNGTCGSAGSQSTLGGNYINQYVYTNLGQLWQGPMNGGSTQEQYLYCDSAHLHQMSNLSQIASPLSSYTTYYCMRKKYFLEKQDLRDVAVAEIIDPTFELTRQFLAVILIYTLAVLI